LENLEVCPEKVGIILRNALKRWASCGSWLAAVGPQLPESKGLDVDQVRLDLITVTDETGLVVRAGLEPVHSDHARLGLSNSAVLELIIVVKLPLNVRVKRENGLRVK